MNWNELGKEVHQVAVETGWWDRRPSFAEIAVMCHSELSEAVEEYRKGHPLVYCGECMGQNAACSGDPCGGVDCLRHFQDRKPEGVAVELADCILRILDYSAAAGVDIDAVIGHSPAYTDVIQSIALCHHHLSQAYIQTTAMYGAMPGANMRLLMCVETIMDWAEKTGVDMEAVLRLKHKYNKGRPYRHGGKVL